MICFPSLLLPLIFAFTAPSNSSTENLSIVISGAEQKPHSRIFVAVYRPSDPFPEFGKGWKNEIYPVQGKSQTISLDLPKGTYALAIFQDINNNNKLDKNVFGYPTEPFGFSRNFRPILGKPNFEDCSVVYKGDNSTLQIKLIR
jgi:uncharacterized protein (DUF2141 family)